jgi:hypothetical protein
MIRPINSMIANPTATILVNGLSLSSHSDDNRFMDIGFLKVLNEDTHPFRMRIFRNNSLYWTTENFPHTYFQNSLIDIDKTNSNGIFAYKAIGGMNNDPYDFQWMFDLAVQVYGVDRFRYQEPTIKSLLARLRIFSGVFYTYLKSDNNAVIFDEENNCKLPLRKIGRVLGADLFCENNEEIRVTIQWLNSSNHPILIPLKPFGGRYWISIDYKCAPDNVDDLKEIYNVIIPPTNQKFSIRFERRETVWTFKRIVGNIDTKHFIDECHLPGFESEFPFETREFFQDHTEAQNAGYTLFPKSREKNLQETKSTEFACQVVGGGGGGVPFPDV